MRVCEVPGDVEGGAGHEGGLGRPHGRAARAAGAHVVQEVEGRVARSREHQAHVAQRRRQRPGRGQQHQRQHGCNKTIVELDIEEIFLIQFN